jgi:4-diphosphocytidyl-2-C-methyl-D-erythritol kinase
MLRALYDVPAPAKLNLFLHVVGRRADGYHLLQSVFQLVDWADTLHFERRDDGRLQRHDLAEALPADDLTLRAARALQAASATTAGADISVHKRLPSGAGMGGGSSDAATALLALNRLWGLGWPRARLLELALPLGADVPFFVGGSNAFVEGIGERLTPLQTPEQAFVVVKPPVSIATGDIFTHPLLRRDTEPAILSGSLEGPTGAPILEPGYGRNDLQPPAEDRTPEVAQAARWLEARYGNSRMTGSGSAVFARAGTIGPSGATGPAESLPPGWVSRQCRSLQQHPLAGWAAD